MVDADALAQVHQHLAGYVEEAATMAVLHFEASILDGKPMQNREASELGIKNWMLATLANDVKSTVVSGYLREDVERHRDLIVDHVVRGYRARWFELEGRRNVIPSTSGAAQ